jgi:hypothetical protein
MTELEYQSGFGNPRRGLWRMRGHPTAHALRA